MPLLAPRGARRAVAVAERRGQRVLPQPAAAPVPAQLRGGGPRRRAGQPGPVRGIPWPVRRRRRLHPLPRRQVMRSISS